nr:mechanosensitive ion channel family protein [uncultured Hyphomonas sp.]
MYSGKVNPRTNFTGIPAALTGWLCAGLLVLCLALMAPAALAQAPEPPADPTPAIQTPPPQASDSEIKTRISDIFAEIATLRRVTVEVNHGVVTLAGEVASTGAETRAEQIALRVNGVVTVENQIERRLAVDDSTAPFFGDPTGRLQKVYRALPLYGVSLGVFLVIALLGHLLASWRSFWRLILPNPFLVELVSGAFRIVMLLVALIAAMNILGATAMMGTILGGAGVVGLAIGFSVRDTLENYISSIMLSVRQPFRANEHVVIDQHEGKVMRLTSRSTVLMTLDGNHLRIPNSTVFKAVILNYTRNPDRRFDFDLGVDAADDPVAAMQLGLDRMKALPFVLKDPEPEAYIQTVGDSNIVLRFMGWVDQRETNFGKARGLAIAATKDALEEGGFTLPEPIYRLRFDSGVEDALKNTKPDGHPAGPPEQPRPKADVDTREAADVAADNTIDEKVAAERASSNEADLLDEQSPVE